MTTRITVLTAGLVLLSLTAGSVLAEDVPPSGSGGGPGRQGGPWGGQNKEHFIEARLAQLHKELKLAPAQEADWQAWSSKVNQTRAARQEAHPDAEALRNMPAPDRLQKMIDLGKTRQARLEEILAATKTFYATLTAEQRKTFDALMPFGERGPRMHRGGPRRSEAR